MKKQKLIILVGLPASGKTSYAREYTKTHPDTVVVSSDRVREDLKDLKISYTDERVVYQELQHRVSKSLRYGKSVIVNATNLKVKYREPYIYLARKINKEIVIEAHVLLADIDECAETDKIKKNLGLDFLRKCMGEFQMPLGSEGYDEIVYKFVSEKSASNEKEMPVNFFTALLQRGEFNGLNTFNLGQAASIVVEEKGFDKETQIATFFALLGKCITQMQEFSQLGAYFMLCHLYARKNVISQEQELKRWKKVIKLINYFSVYANWGKRYNKLFTGQEKKELQIIYDTIHEIKTQEQIVQIFNDYYNKVKTNET